MEILIHLTWLVVGAIIGVLILLFIESREEGGRCANTSTNTTQAEICRCHFGSVLSQFNSTGTGSKLNYCSACGGKLSAVR